MATIPTPQQGILDIGNIQGNYREINLEFTDGDDVPINLTDFDAIRMEIKEIYSVKYKPFLVFEVGTGLTISGDNSNVLTFILDKTFWEKQIKDWVYDIVFQIGEKRFTFIKGKITDVLTASQT